MKADDPLLEAKRQEVFERIQRMDELLLTIVKNHVGLEQFISEFLTASGRDPEALTFFKKIKACEDLKPQEVEASVWGVFYAANELRNKMAHTYDEKKVKEKLDALRAKYIVVLNTPAQKEAANKLTDVQLAAGAMQLCGAHIVVATERVRAGQK